MYSSQCGGLVRIVRSVNMQAVIFDCDGVLVDSERLELLIMRDALGWLGVDPAEAEGLQHRCRGGSLAGVIDDMACLAGTPVADDFIDRYRTHQLKGLVDVQAVPGAVDAVAWVTEHGYPKAVASGGPMDKMAITLPAVGLWETFDPHIFSCYSIDGDHKPAPDVYLHGAAALGVEPSSCLVFEDSPNGVAAGAAAGMHVVGLSRDTAAKELLSAGAAETVHDLSAAITVLDRVFGPTSR